MEKIPAAFAMEWSIELEKSLRSKKPGKSIEAIQEIGPKLEWWNSEPKLTMAEYNLFGLIPGEDKLFANAILLRLADAFNAGDKHTKLCVVKVFLTEYKNRKKKRRNNGILSKNKLFNHLEVLRRVKIVFQTGDVEVRAMVLVLFGCWADFAHESTEIRYLILSSAVSSDVLEVKASLFAAGCFCELSDDFAFVLLEILVNILSSSETSVGIRLAGVRALAKMGCLYSLASKAYKAGLKLLSYSSEEDFCVAMLLSLSKLAVKSTLLISTQVEMLFSILNQDKSLRSQATSLKCLHFILAGGAYGFHASTSEIKTMFSMLNEPKFPPALQCIALQILHKILLQNLFNFSCPDMLEILSELLTIVENGIQYSTMSKRLLATLVLVDIYDKFTGGVEIELHGVKFHSFASRMVTFVVDRIFLLAELHPVELETEQEVKRLLNHLLRLVEAHSDLCHLVLDNIHLSIRCLAEKHGRVMGSGEVDLSGHESLFGENKTVITTKLMLYISKVLASCLESIDKAGAFTAQVRVSVKLVVEDVHNSSLFDCYTHTIYSILFWSHITYYSMQNCTEENNIVKNLGIPDHDFSVQHEILTLEYSMKLLAGKDNWLAYKAGKYAACHGAWFAAAFIFWQLVKLVESDHCSCWLRSLAEFAHSEMKVQFLLLPKQGSGLLNWLESYGISGVPFGDYLHGRGKGTASKVNSSNHVDNLISVCKILHSSEELLGATSRPATTFGFQRWFLSLRSKVLENVVDMLKLLDTIPLTEDKISSNQPVNGNNMVEIPERLLNINSLLHPLTQMSVRLKRLAQEFDLMATSFIGMDCKSLMTISVLALSCSLLAFSSGFSLFITNLHAMKSSTNSGLEKSEESLFPILILDLLSRLWHVDRETSTKLMLLLNACGQPRSYFPPQSRNHIVDISTETRRIITLCSFAVAGAVGLQIDANRMHHDLIQLQLTSDGLQLLLNIITKWMQIPFRTPTYFFRIRPPLSSQLFTLDRDARHGGGLSIFRGFHLSLDLCLQLTNMPPDLPTRLTKLYCILSTSISYQVPFLIGGETRQVELGFQDWQTDDMVDLNEKLLQYVTGRTKTGSTHKSNNAGDCRNVEVFMCFEPNLKGQGFCTCLLDVSAFPVGSYRIKWHSCYIDNDGSYWNLLPLNPGPILTVQ